MSGCPDADALLQAGAPAPRDACAEAMAEIAALPEGLLEHRRRRWLSEHVSRCATCRETVSRMALFDYPTGDLPALVLDPDAWKRPPPPARPSRSKRPVLLLVGVAAVVAAAAAAAAAVVAVRATEPRVVPIVRE